VVIGKGKLIANTSIKDMISGSAHSSVFVRANDMRSLKTVLQKAEIAFSTADGGLTVTGVKTDQIGKLAFGAGLTILELANHNASLEDAFLELTEGAEEYKTGSGGEK